MSRPDPENPRGQLNARQAGRVGRRYERTELAGELSDPPHSGFGRSRSAQSDTARGSRTTQPSNVRAKALNRLPIFISREAIESTIIVLELSGHAELVIVAHAMALERKWGFPRARGGLENRVSVSPLRPDSSASVRHSDLAVLSNLR